MAHGHPWEQQPHHCLSVCGCGSEQRDWSRSGGCVGESSVGLHGDGNCELEQHQQSHAVCNVVPFGTWLWHPDLPTFRNPQMEKWHLKLIYSGGSTVKLKIRLLNRCTCIGVSMESFLFGFTARFQERCVL